MTATPTRNCRFCLVRHGETDWNTERRLQGQLDIGLNAAGLTQARAVRSGLAGQRFVAVYSSTLARAWVTAEIATAGSGLAVSPAPTLRERHYGVYQGLTSAEAAERHPQVHRRHQRRDIDFDYENGESLSDFATRVMTGLTEIAERHAGEAVLGFTHGGVLDIVYRAAIGRGLEGPRDFPIPNAGLNWLEYEDGAWRILHWADQRHLATSLDEFAV